MTTPDPDWNKALLDGVQAPVYDPAVTFTDFTSQVNSNWATAKTNGLAGDRLSGRGLRYGQVFFNTLHGAHPRLADDIRSTHRDPFHKDEVKAEIWDYCCEKWDTTERST